MRQPYFSIVIPTLNEEKFLPMLLRDLVEQSWGDFEVINVDGGSDDRTVAIAKRFSKQLKLRQIISEKKNVSHQRNLGAEVASGEWIIFIDADTQIGPDFLLTLRYKISLADRKKRTKFDVFTTLIKLNQEDKKKTKHQAALRTSNSRMSSTAGSDKPLLFGALLGVRAQYFGAVRFDEKIKFAEDIYFVRDLIALGAEYKLLRTPTYFYSMRRWDDENFIKNTAKAMKLEFKIALGDEYKGTNYDMLGGGKY
jgi:glycosyltransferase involved in cell wall biosynthesis